MCLVKFLEDVNIIIKNVNDINDFKKYVIGIMGKFIVYDARCYEDLKKTNFIHDGGNPKLMYPKIEDREYNGKQGELKLPPKIKDNLWEYFSDIYPFIKDATEEDKKGIIENDIYKGCNSYFKLLRMILLLPFATLLINQYGCDKLNEFYMENN